MLRVCVCVNIDEMNLKCKIYITSSSSTSSKSKSDIVKCGLVVFGYPTYYNRKHCFYCLAESVGSNRRFL